MAFDAKSGKRKRILLLKAEKQSDNVIIRDLKDYIFDSEEHIKGLRKDAEQISQNRYKTVRFLKFRSLLREGSLDAPVTEEYIKELKREYRKGIVNPDGSITPFVLSESPPDTPSAGGYSASNVP